MRHSFLAACLAALAGCSTGVASDLGIDVVKIGLVGDGSSLKLANAPSMPGDRSRYPNPRHHEWMSIYVTSDARVVVSCRTASGKVACADSPISVRLEGTRARPVVAAYDLYQHRLAAIPYTGSRCTPGSDGPSGMPAGLPEGPGSGSGTGTPVGNSGSTGGTGTPVGNTPLPAGTPGAAPPPIEGPGSAGGGGSGSVGTSALSLEEASDPNVSIQVEDPGDVPGGDGDAPSLGHACPTDTPTPPGGSTCGVLARSRFCGLVNEGLRSRQLKFTYDCGHLELEQSFPRPVLDGEVHCKREITAPAGAQTLHEYGSCDSNLVRTWEDRALAEIRNTGLCGGSPLVLDVDGDGLSLRSAAAGPRFDLAASGAATRTGWVGAGDGLLAIDANGNGSIDDGSELFGQVTFGASFADGFAALSTLDADRDGAITGADPRFGQLVVWLDENGDGRGGPEEWRTLPQLGIERLSLGAQARVRGSSADGLGNWLPLQGHFARADGTRGQLVDVWFGGEP